MQSKELRRKFLEFFEERGHKIVPSSSLIPNDPSVLFTTAGMQQFRKCYLQPEEVPASRAVTIQPCLRTSDIEEVGDESHLTFFEMLGNFSFGYPQKDGSYFKKEAIEWAWEFLTDKRWLGIDSKRIAATYFKGEEGIKEDKESLNELKKINGLKIKPQGLKDNFWSLGTEGSPGGPTVEFYIDGIEIWNLVFNEYIFQNGKYVSSKYKGVDTGMGLERLAAVLNDLNDVYETDALKPIIEKIEEISGKKYVENHKAFRIITDHLKAAIFLLIAGINPSNIVQGYVLRRLIRRAVRYGWLINIKTTLTSILDSINNTYSDICPQINNEQNVKEIVEEEKKFQQTIQIGLKKADKIFSFKIPLTQEDYSKVMQFERRSSILHRINKSRVMNEVDSQFQKEEISITNRQIQDAFISGKEAFDLYQTYGFPLELILDMAQEKHLFVSITSFQEELKKHQQISRAGAEKKFGGIGKEADLKSLRLHTATHLLHAALRQVLGEHVRQMGSDITFQRLRFDFSHPTKMSDEEIKKVADLVNQKIKENLEVQKEKMSYREAIESGALAFFKEKYPEAVSVYSINNFSKEICAGPHAEKTLELGQFKIIKEESSGAGIRRIRGVLQ